MTTAACFTYHFGRRFQLPESGITQLKDENFRATDKTMHQLGRRAGEVAPWADDLLHIARAVFLADKRSTRRAADDGWTRTISLTVEVVDPEPWQSRTADVNRLLALLTGDRWHIDFVAGGARYAPSDAPLFPLEGAEVALFSGGLDSTAYAADRMRTGGGALVLVSYHEPDDIGYQRKLVGMLKGLGERPVFPNELPLQTFAENGKALELSARSRGLLFLATALYVASGHKVTTVTVPENGQLAINPPLTPARPAACSTRSVHPTTLAELNRLVANIGGDIEILNPFAELTKGEVCIKALEAGLSEKALWTTVSCGRPPVKRGAASFHCGRCFPCLVRRAGLLSATGRDETQYEFGLVADEGPWPEDLHALWWWLTHRFSERELLGDLTLPATADLSVTMDVITRGRAELAQMVRRTFGLDDRAVVHK
ncbi:7-cyano-7-deazaguanine synthase [Actinomadura opuntiae]|uniref:7-cyano-7-deazaguanine synthase n=1 Tax=Actinomadura sp. OS1-43 TaxID=604315 RepID=UPI00255B225A|nr:7-cyano-7-deazaguanine synthase [Actinomadura sp. OS1-43]MDL4819102.1 7-cyano-7-deazaguanine synthase [Actinomadura sp. OS1-43]